MNISAKKISMVITDTIAVILFLVFHITIIVFLGLILAPILLWKWIEKIEVRRHGKNE